MKILVIGSGGREHALVWKLGQSPRVSQLYCAPGNAGTQLADRCENIGFRANDILGLLEFAKENRIDLTVVGPEEPLVNGIVDRFQMAGLRIFGPNARAAQVEGSKAFAKKIMEKYGIPTARARKFTAIDAAWAYVEQQGAPIVIKADGLAAGKGVAVCRQLEEARAFLKQVMVSKAFGKAGEMVIVEEMMTGQEASVLALTDGHTVLPLSPAQDHKPIGEGDTGPNTGGMGAYSPTPVMDAAMEQQVLEQILRPMVAGLRAEGMVYKGILYAGLMMDASGPRVVEFNCRLGDPETQCVLPRLKNDLLELMLAVTEETLDTQRLVWDPRFCLNVVMAAQGYPGSYTKGQPITGLEQAGLVFHAGTSLREGQVLCAGGRVLNVVGLGTTLKNAIENTYQDVAKIHFEGAYFRRDIGQRVL